MSAVLNAARSPQIPDSFDLNVTAGELRAALDIVAAEAVAAERERIVAAVERLPDSVGGEPEWDGKFESGWVNRAVVLAIVRGIEDV